MKENPKLLQSDKYCCYHKYKGHAIDECFSLQAEIEKLIKRGYFGNFEGNSKDQQQEGIHDDRRWAEDKKYQGKREKKWE